MAHYNVVVQDSSPLLVYSPPNAWVDTPFGFKDSSSTSYHATQGQGASVKLDFVGTGVRLFSATAPTPGSYRVYVDGKELSEGLNSSSKSDSPLLLGSISGLTMGPHTVTLVNTGVTGDTLDIEHVQVESVVTTGSSPLSAANFDDTVGAIRWGPGWVSAPGPSTFYNSTVHYTEQPDAEMGFSFEGDAIAIYGATGVEIGDYVVTLDGQSRAFNGGSNGSVQSAHYQTMLYLASGLSAGRHELTITANPSSLGNPQVFSVDSIRVFSGSSTGPRLLLPGSSSTGISSTLPQVSTGSSYTSLISSTVLPKSTPLPTSTSSTLPHSSMTFSPFTPSLLSPLGQFNSIQQNHGLREASDKYKVMTDKGVLSSAVFSAFVAVIGLVFFALFLWKRKTLEPPSYIDIEKGNEDERGPRAEPGEMSPELPIQPAEKMSPSLEGNNDPFTDYALYVHYPGYQAERMRGHSRTGSDSSSMTSNDSAYSMYREILQKRSLLTQSTASFDDTCRDSVSDRDSRHLAYSDRGSGVDKVLSVYSVSSRYSQMSERIVINSVRMPPQFATPMRPPSVALPSRPKYLSPPRPPRGRGGVALPF